MMVAFHRFLMRHFSGAHVEQIEGHAQQPPPEERPREHHYTLDADSHHFIETPDPPAPNEDGEDPVLH